jgi:TolA-binding protein
MQKDKSKAAVIIEKTLAVDSYNPTALWYQKELGITKVKPLTVVGKDEKNDDISRTNYAKIIEKDKKGFADHFNFFGIVLLLLGAICGFSIFYFLIMPSTISTNKTAVNQLNSKIAVLEKEKNDLVTSSDKTISELNNLNNDLEQRNSTLEEKVSLQEKILNINRASDLINSNIFEEASALLTTIDKTGLPVDLVDKYDGLVAKAHPRTAVILYNNGVAKYKAKEYDEAIVMFNDCLKYAEPTVSQVGDSLYYLGEIALVKEDVEAAKKYFTSVADEHQNAKNYWTAKNKLARL